MSLRTYHRLAILVPAISVAVPFSAQAAWMGYAGDGQHSALSSTASQDLLTIRWQTPVDLAPQYSGTALLIHYGSPMVTPANTVIVPVKTGASGGFKVEGRDGANGALKWSSTTDYILPFSGWTPSFSPAITNTGRIYYPGAGGTVFYRDSVDSNSPTAPTRVAFFGTSNYNANSSTYNSAVKINTPITSDSAGNVYFGYQVTGSNPLGLTSGIARVAPDGSAIYTPISSLGVAGASKVATNSAPALSADGTKIYFAVNNGGTSQGALVRLDAATLSSPVTRTLFDPRSVTNRALIPDDGTASPLIGPDGDVYFGTLEDYTHYAFTSKGWMMHFSSDLSTQKPTGAFGWDDTASIVPSSMVPSYSGSSSYLLMTKYNNYAGTGGDGVNKIAILDPNDTQIDARSGATVMKEILTIAGVTPDDEYNDVIPTAVREWCINTAVVDPATKSILANSEDGKLYRWDLTTNTFTQQIVLTPGIGEAYTPTLIGSDGTVYAINNATLFAVGVPEPTGILAASVGAIALLRRSRRRISKA